MLFGSSADPAISTRTPIIGSWLEAPPTGRRRSQQLFARLCGAVVTLRGCVLLTATRLAPDRRSGHPGEGVAPVAAAYLARRCGMTGSDALAWVRHALPRTRANPAFGVWPDERASGGWGRVADPLAAGDVIEFDADYTRRTGRTRFEHVARWW